MWSGQRRQQRTWKEMSMVLVSRRRWEGRTWCRDVAGREGQDNAFESRWLLDMEETETRGKGDGFQGPCQILDTEGERTQEVSLCVKIKGVLTKRP